MALRQSPHRPILPLGRTGRLMLLCVAGLFASGSAVADQAVLKAIVIQGNQRQAFMEHGGAPKGKWVKSGDTMGDWIVGEIDDLHVSLVNGKVVVYLQLNYTINGQVVGQPLHLPSAEVLRGELPRQKKEPRER
jgi:hypothetical protein